MDKFDQYKRLLRLGIAGIEIILEAAFFTYVWYVLYNGRKVTPFENKGNLMMVGFSSFLFTCMEAPNTPIIVKDS